jgi:hypothetical protein
MSHGFQFRRSLPVTLLLAALGTAVPAAAATDLTITPRERPLTLSFDGVESDKVASYAASGWPMSLTMTIREPFLGIETIAGDRYPSQIADQIPGSGPNEGPFRIVYNDPDGCQSLSRTPIAGGACPEFGAPSAPIDERNVEFAPGVSVPGTPDNAADSETGPTIPILAPIGFSGQQYFGPDAGSRSDGYGYGPSWRMPGLVLLSNVGIGIISDSNFDRSPTRQCRNLAGFLNSVSLTLNNGDGRSSLHMHTNVPPELFSPIALVDRDVTALPACPGDSELIRFESGPAQCMTRAEIDAAYDRNVNVRAVVVSLDDIGRRKAPRTVTDFNGNGVCDAGDLRLAGYRVVSNTALIRFRQLHQNDTWDFGYPFPADLDGNGTAGLALRFTEIIPSARGGRLLAPR